MEIIPPLVCPAPWHKLLVCTDGSAEGQNAVAAALQLARACGSLVRVVQVLVSEVQAMAPTLRARMVSEVEKNLADIEAAAAQLDVPIQLSMPENQRPPAAIFSEAERYQPDLIIMGRRGKTSLTRLLMGSVTSQVIGRSPVNVMVVPLGAGVGFQCLLVALDGSPFSEAASKVALAMTKQAGSRLLAVAVAAEKRHVSETKAILQKMLAAAQEAGLPRKRIKGVSPQGVAPHMGILQETINHQGDLIIMGSYGRTGIKKILMGSTTERVIGHAPCPILIVK